MIPLGRVDLVTRRRGVAQGARIAGLDGDVEELNGVTSTGGQERRRWISEVNHEAENPDRRPDSKLSHAATGMECMLLEKSWEN